MIKKYLSSAVILIALLAIFFHAETARARQGKSKDSDDKQQIVIAQISDSHIGLARAPEASENLRKVVDMVNQRNPDAVVVTGDIGERPEAWEEAKKIYAGLKAPVYYVPGNHDVSSTNVARYRQAFGKDYMEVHVGWVTILGLDSELLGNYDKFDTKQTIPLPAATQDEANKMLSWLSGESDHMRRGGHSAKDLKPASDQDDLAKKDRKEKGKNDGDKSDGDGAVILAMQHVPISLAGNFPSDGKPYWTTQEPYRSKELDLLHKLGVKHMLVGHWHKGMIYNADGITYHVAPATSWSPFGAPLGFAMHTVTHDGNVKTEFVELKGADPHTP